MEFKKIEEGMTATQVAELLDDNFNNIAKEIENNIGENNVPIATEERIGGIVARPKTSEEQSEVKIDPETGRLYTRTVTVEGGVVPDGEDLTSVDVGGNVVARFKDRGTTKGKGYIILRTEKSLVEQMTQENTIYEVRYDFDLGGETLEVPANCVLDFKGGSFDNGLIIGNRTKFVNTNTGIFKNITLSGSYDIEGLCVEWFRTSDLTDSQLINKVIANAYDIAVYQVLLAPIRYNINEPITIKTRISLRGVYYSTILYATNKNIIITWNALTDFTEICNIVFQGEEGKAIYNSSYDYASTWHIHDCEFYGELDLCIRGNFILSMIDKCIFGYHGTAGTNHTHIVFKGDTDGRVSNINKITDSRFYRSTGEYACVFDGGFDLLISKCNFELCNNSVSTIKFSGFNTLEVNHCWFEHCLGDRIIDLVQNTEGLVYGNYIIDFNHNYFYMNNANKYIFWIKGANYNVEFTHNYASNFNGKYITFDGGSYDIGVKTFYRNRLLPAYNGTLVNHFDLPVPVTPSTSSKGLIADPWFKTWDTNNLNGWNKTGITAWIKYNNDDELGKQFDGGVRFIGSNDVNNAMYISIPLFLVKGKTIKIEAVYKAITNVTGAAYRIGYRFDTPNPSYLTTFGNYMQNKDFAKVSGTIEVPTDALYCIVGIGSPGANIQFVLKAFDVFIVDGIIDPTISNDTLIEDKSIKLSLPKIGDYYFDVSKGKPLFWNGTEWVDSAGVADVSEVSEE